MPLSDVTQQTVTLVGTVLLPVKLGRTTEFFIRVAAVGITLSYNSDGLPAMTLPANAEYRRGGLNGADRTIYLKAASGTTVDVEVWN